MKHSIQLIYVFSLFIGSFVFSSCNKHHEEENPCDDPVEVIATDPSLYNFGHFVLKDGSTNGFAPSQTYLYAVNWNDFSSKFTPGKHYLLGFKYVECKNRETESGSGEDNGRCGIPILKCIEICCVKDVKAQSCFGLGFDEPDFGHLYSHAVSNSYIENNSLKTTAYFSGCSQNDPVSFRLELQELSLLRPSDSPTVYVAKVNEINPGYTCMAVFNREVCFDLTELTDRYKRNNLDMPEDIILHLYEGNEIKEIKYHPEK